MNARTSRTHPLRIGEVRIASGGRIGLTFCPGKTQPDALTGAWRRDLAVDLDAIRGWGATVVLTLVEAHEMAELGVADLGREVAERGMAWRHLPIEDYGVPGPAFETAYDHIAEDLHRRLAAGEAALVHCKGGLGRAGLVAARLLVEAGHAPQDAVRLVRSVRPGAIETPGQMAYVLARGARNPAGGSGP